MKTKISFALIAVLIIIIPNAVTSLAAGVDFAAAVNYSVGDQPYSVAIDDLDGDNHPDLVVANWISDNISVLINNGDGTFAAAVNYSPGDGSFFVAINDLDGDNHPDLAVANYDDNNVSVLINNGNGTFAAPVNYSVGSGPYSIAIDDLDGDNHLDLAVASKNAVWPNNVSVLINNGDGTFAAPVTYGAGSAPYSVAIDDLDGDNHPDLAVAGRSSHTVSVLINNGDGTFAAAVNYNPGIAPYSVAIDDLDGDNHPDLAVANANTDNVSVLINNGDGTFAAAVNYNAGDGPASVAINDLDGDNHPDLAVANWGTDNVSVLINNNDGTFAAAVNYDAGNGPFFVAIDDLDSDNLPDLAVVNRDADNVSVLINRSIFEGDYGDASDPTYPTLFASDGARHTIDPGLYLGAAVDSESDGQPNATATGDNNADTDDENGVTFDTAAIAGRNLGLTVTASDAGKLDAWIDFSGNGDWADAGEQVFANQDLIAGANALTVAVPIGAAAGDTFARFRFSTVGGLSYTGPAADGEVEDYALTIAVCASPAAPTLTSPTGITDQAMSIYVWESNPCADHYYLLIQNQLKKTIFKQRYLAATVDNGDGTCSINPFKVLPSGGYYWLVRAGNQYGVSPNSAKMAFTVATTQVPPAAPTLNTPTGTIADTMPTFDWDTVATAENYYLIIQNSGQKSIYKKWYAAADVDNLDGTCSINPGKTLPPGDYYWRVRAKNQYGDGANSAKMAFTISP